MNNLFIVLLTGLLLGFQSTEDCHNASWYPFMDENNTSANSSEYIRHNIVSKEQLHTYPVGFGSDLTNNPYNFLWNKSLQQSLYLAEEIASPGGSIVAIEYRNNFNESLNDVDIQIWMGSTAQKSVASGWVDPSGLLLVYDGRLSFPQGTNDIYIPLERPFIHTGENIVIQSLKTDNHYSSGKNFYNTTIAESGRTRRAQADVEELDPMNPPAGSVVQSFPNVKFHISTIGFGSLEGTITDGSAPLGDVLLELAGTSYRAISDATGSFAFPLIPVGAYTLRAALTGYQTQTIPLVIKNNEATMIDTGLTALTSISVTGKVVSSKYPDSGIEGVLVNLSGYTLQNITTDANGNFHFENVFADQPYRIEIKMTGHDLFKLDFHADLTDMTLETIVLEYTGKEDIVVGADHTFPPSRIPFDFFFQTSATQSLYYPREIGIEGGYVSGISYEYSFVSDLQGKTVMVWLGETEANDLSAGWIDPESLHLVFDGSIHLPADNNSIFIEFQNPWLFRGKNLVVYTVRVFEQTFYDASDRFFGTLKPNSHRTLTVNSELGFHPLSPPPGTLLSWIANTKLHFSIDGLGGLSGAITYNDNPVTGVLVALEGTDFYTHTDPKGEYHFPVLPTGNYNLIFSKFGFHPLVIDGVELAEDKVTRLETTMQAIPQYTVSGTIKGNDGFILSGAEVTLDGYSQHKTLSDEDGSFTFSAVFSGTYELTVKARGFDAFTEKELVVEMDTLLTAIILNETIIAPASLKVDTRITDYGNALLTWEWMSEKIFPVTEPIFSEKKLLGFNVFLDNLSEPLATAINEKQYLFTGLTQGDYIAGVQSVFTTDVSDIVTVSFTIDEPPVARVQFIHISPDKSLEGLDIYHGEELLVPGLMWHHSTDFLEVETQKELPLFLVPAGMDRSMAKEPFMVNFTSDGTYVAIINGFIKETELHPPLQIYFAHGKESAENGNETEIMAFNGSFDFPEAALDVMLDYPVVHLCTIKYGEFSTYFSFPANDHTFFLRKPDEAHVYTAPRVPLKKLELEGMAGVMVLSGFLNPIPETYHTYLGFYLALPVAGEMIYLPEYINHTSNHFNNQGLRIFPNPVRDIVSIESDSELKLIQIMDLRGRVLYNRKISGNHYKTSLPILGSGIYLLRVDTVDGQITQRIQVIDR